MAPSTAVPDAELTVGEQFQQASDTDPVIGRIVNATDILVVTGAGMSVPSGLPTFRGPNGLYETASEEPPVHRRDLTGRPEELVAWHENLHELSQRAEPNEGHWALADKQAELEAVGGSMTLATMNVDDLHDRTGSVVHHVHGRVDEERCDRCGTIRPVMHAMSPCVCGSFFRSNVILFGEPLAQPASDTVDCAVRNNIDVLYVVGSSGATGGCWSWVVNASRRGVITVMVAVDPDAEFASEFDVVINDTAANIGSYLPVCSKDC